ncbi:MAG: NAD(P)/FAD-dependent oxidoreductase [Parasporobacterium sp.]|nr:NAD(P)/FAD-dependent oxidoreductase [Parasporobacterium sp.]
MKQYVIIGNGPAAAGCIEGIRSIDRHSPITVISEENHPVYGRPLISYFLEGKTDPEHMLYRNPDFYERNRCRVLYGRKAVKLQKRPKRILLDDRTELPWTSVCIAAGSGPFVPPMKGLETVSKKHTFMTLDDARELKEAVGPDSRVLIIGAGLIGLKCAEGLHALTEHITVCDLADRVLSSILDAPCAAIVQKHLERHGIRFLLSDSADRFEDCTAYMKSGEKVEFDVLVLAVGVKANTSLAKEAGCTTGRGIAADSCMRTDVPGVYTAGDCCEGMDISLGARRVLAIMPNAYMQGHTAGVNMAGGEETFEQGIPMNSLGLLGLHIMTAGTYYTEEQGGECYEEQTKDRLKRLYMKDGFLTGFILIGQVERAGIYTSLIRERTPLQNVDLEMLKKIATTAAFSPSARKQKFGKEN